MFPACRGGLPERKSARAAEAYRALMASIAQLAMKRALASSRPGTAIKQM
jgi:hypothetical protein